MKIISVTLLSIILIIILIVGNIRWENYSPSSSTTSKNEISNLENTIEIDYYLSHTKNWPEDAQNQFYNKLKNKEVYRILLLGSNSIGNSKTGLLPILKDTLSNTYDSNISIESIVYDSTTSNYVLDEESKNLIDKKPDMIIFEPFLLLDNNNIELSNTIRNISLIIEETKEALPSITFVLQPPNQIYDANLYPIQVSTLKEYSESRNITFLNHWENWPDGKSKEILNYINTDGSPNEKGYEVWGNYITDFLVNK